MNAKIEDQNGELAPSTALESSEHEQGGNLKNTFDDILSRIRQACGAKSDKKLSEILDITYSAITAARKRGAIPPAWYVLISEKYGVSMDWLRTGEEGPRRGTVKFAKMRPGERWDDSYSGSPDGPLWKAGLYQRRTEEPERQPSACNDSDEEDFDLAEVLAQTLDILKSKTVYTTAIVSNIKAFHKAISTEKKIDEMQGQLNQALSSFQAQLDKTNQLVQGLQSENAQLRQELEDSRSGSSLSDTG